MTKVEFIWDKTCQYGAPDWVVIKVNGERVAKVEWINGPPYLSAKNLVGHRNDSNSD